jgi:LPXTG-site transpeptidase (sortase) family protein
MSEPVHEPEHLETFSLLTKAPTDAEMGWVTVEETIVATPKMESVIVQQVQDPLVKTQLKKLQALTRETLEEGMRQYRESIQETQPALLELEEATMSSAKKFLKFLSQPVWIPSRKNTVKQYSRGTLFLLDTVRFGGTFAGIFVVLFLSLNYQSFWQIAQARFENFMEPPSIEKTDSMTAALGVTGGSPLGTKPEGEVGNLASFLPEVGPPDSQLLIPKLKIIAPIVLPNTDALLRQDWAAVEKDIQDSLQHGVVHYPGTAKPGQAGNFFVTGHSSYYAWAHGNYNSIFARLHELDIGDEYWVYYNGDKHRYIVRSKKEVSPSDITVLDQPTDQRIATLMTCTPVGTTLRRLIVVAQEVDPETGIALDVGEKSQVPAAQKVQLGALPI